MFDIYFFLWRFHIKRGYLKNISDPYFSDYWKGVLVQDYFKNSLPELDQDYM